MKKNSQQILIWTCCLLLVAMSNFVFAQTTFTEALTHYFKVKNDTVNFGNKTMRSGLIQYTDGLRTMEMVKISSDISTSEIVDRYMEEQLTTDFIEEYLPYFTRTGITTEQLNELSALMETEDGKRAMSHSRTFESVENLAGVIKILQEDMMKLSQGGKVKDKTANASKERRQLFSQFYKNAQMADLVAVYVETYSMVFAVDKKAGKQVLKYFDKNWETLLLSASDVLTDEDLKFLNHIAKYPQYSKCVEATTAALDDIVTMSRAILSKYDKWVRENYNEKNTKYQF